ncbi:MAG: hypothetical protein HUJ73_04945 [Eubacterium sp.]|nr:hypothetical protein [Eubacterium sp.]
MSCEEADELIQDAWEAYAAEAGEDEERLEEISAVEEYSDGIICEMSQNDRTMRYFVTVRGEPDENGLYPLYITLHGGGGAPAEANDEQWQQMCEYYKGRVENGIYVACRGIEDEWNLHFRDESYAFYDRLISNMILFAGADPNRVYLMGFSAGGDGVYAISPRMADRFAAVNMSSGHPNGVSMLNMANLPIAIQVGVRDFYSESVMRCVRGAEMENILNSLREKYGFGYPHQVWVHVPEGHNFSDYEEVECKVLADPAVFAERAAEEDWLDDFLALPGASGMDVMGLSYAYYDETELNEQVEELLKNEKGMDIVSDMTCAVDYVNGFTRNPAPEQLVWDLSCRAPLREVNSFYWLSADSGADSGIITAAYNTDDNSITLTADEVNGDFDILFNPQLVDVSRPVTIVTESGSMTVTVKPSYETACEAVELTGDPGLAWVDSISYSEIMDALK